MTPPDPVTEALELDALERRADERGFPPGEFHAYISYAERHVPGDTRLRAARGLVRMLDSGIHPDDASRIIWQWMMERAPGAFAADLARIRDRRPAPRRFSDWIKARLYR